MRHPRIPGWVEFKLKKGQHVIENHLEGSTFTVKDPALWAYAQQLDGRDPATVAGAETVNVDLALQELDKNDLLRTGKFFFKSFDSIYITLYEPKCIRARNSVPFLLDTIRLMLWFPMLAAGWYCFLVNFPFLSNDSAVWGVLLGCLTGMILHEISHAISAMRWGALCFEIGFSVTHFVIPGMYTLLNDDRVKNPLHKALIITAGVESNFMLSGLFAWLSVICEGHSYTFLMAAMMNLLLALINLLPGVGIDGERVLSHLLGTVNASEKAASLLIYGWHRNLEKYGVRFRLVAHAVAATLLLTKTIIPIFLIYQIMELISLCF